MKLKVTATGAQVDIDYTGEMWLKRLFLPRVAGLPGVTTAGVREHIYIIVCEADL